MLGHTMMRHRFPRLFRVKRKLLWLRKVSISPPRIREYLRTRRFWSDLARDCPDQALLSQYRAELAGIAASLEGGAFLSFVGNQTPELQ
jgi:hypothetical protein